MKIPNHRNLILLAVSLLIAVSVFAADTGISVRASVDRKTILVGDRIKYKIAVTHPKDVEVEPIKFKDDRIGSFEIKASGSSAGVNWYYITAYSVGENTIPPVDIRYRKTGVKEWKAQKTDSVKITVASVLPKGARISDIKDVKGPIYFKEIPWGLTLFVVTALSVAALLIMMYIRKRARAAMKLPYEIALEELDRARAIYLENSNAKEYYAAISDSVRRYIERVFAVKAPEMTTEEFLGYIRESSKLSDRHKDLLKLFLSACDLVKFAKHTPAREEIASVLTTGKNFIEETKPLKTCAAK